MKAAVLRGARDIRIEEVPDPKVEPSGILVKVKACGICGSDLHIYKRGGQEGTIFGHEFGGEVIEVGTEVSDINKGDRVSAVGYRPCEQCYWCKQKQFHRCNRMLVAGYALPGAMAEYILIPIAQLGRSVFRLSENLTYEDGATVEPLSVAVNAVRRAQPKAEDTAVVLGAGMIGLCTVQVLKAMGVSKIIISGRRSKRLEAAIESGADIVSDAAKENLLTIVEEETSGIWADIIFECAGSPETFQQAVTMAHSGAKVMLVAAYEQPISWDPTIVMSKTLSLIGCLRGSFPRAIDLMESGKVNMKPLVSHEFPLYQASEAFKTQLSAQDAIKVLIKP